MRTWPPLFVSHGAPTFATEPGLAGAQLRALSRALGKPRAVVVVSPHWMTREVEITATERPQTIHDFGGFPRELYALQYSAPGSPALAAQIQQLLAAQGIQARLDTRRGLDHGAWVPLLHLYPDADVPVLQVSMPFDTEEAKAYALGRALAPLAQDGVLIVGSGSLTHNLFAMTRGARAAPAPGWVTDFVDWVHARAGAGDAEALADWTRAPYAKENHPTPEHYLPLPFAAGAGGPGAKGRRLHHSIDMGVLAMDVYAFG